MSIVRLGAEVLPALSSRLIGEIEGFEEELR